MPEENKFLIFFVNKQETKLEKRKSWTKLLLNFGNLSANTDIMEEILSARSMLFCKLKATFAASI